MKRYLDASKISLLLLVDASMVMSWATGTVPSHPESVMRTKDDETAGAVPDPLPKPEDELSPFAGVWMLDTSSCPSFGVHMNLSKWGMTGTAWGDKGCSDNHWYWKGKGSCNLLTFSYGLWPVIGKNGDLPQLGNLTAHLEHVERVLQSTPADWQGLGAWDFESWDPVWERNGPPHMYPTDGLCNGCGVYQNASRALVRKRHPTWNESQVEVAAKIEWEVAARAYFEQTLLLSRKLRPRAKFGFYNFPSGSDKIASGSCGGTWHGCNAVTPIERSYDDRVDWLWAASGALFPSNYVCSVGGGPWGQGNATAEAMRVASNLSIPVFPFVWPKQCLPDPVCLAI